MKKLSLIGLTAVACLIGCAGAVERDDDASGGSPAPQRPAGPGGATNGGSPALPPAATAGANGLVLQPAGGTPPFLPDGIPPTRDPSLPGVDFDDGGWIQLGWGPASGGTSSTMPPQIGGNAGAGSTTPR